MPTPTRDWCTRSWGRRPTSADVSQTEHLLHGEEDVVFADAGYIGADKREAVKDRALKWHIAMKRGKLKAMAEGRLKELTRASRTAQSPAALPRRAAVSCHQEPVRSSQGALQGPGQEHRPAALRCSPWRTWSSPRRLCCDITAKVRPENAKGHQNRRVPATIPPESAQKALLSQCFWKNQPIPDEALRKNRLDHRFPRLVVAGRQVNAQARGSRTSREAQKRTQ